MATLVIHIDSSGSTEPCLEAFAAEVAKLSTYCEESTILVADAALQQVVPTNQIPQFLQTLTIKGGGGTSHLPVFEWITKARLTPDLIVSLTALHSEFPSVKPRYPILWCTPEAHAEGPGWGRIVEIPDQTPAAQAA